MVAPLACAIAGEHHPVFVDENTRAHSIYNQACVTEAFYCNYGLNPDYEAAFLDSGMRFSARGIEGEPRVLELDSHRFFVATLYVPQATSTSTAPHPALEAFLAAAAD